MMRPEPCYLDRYTVTGMNQEVPVSVPQEEQRTAAPLDTGNYPEMIHAGPAPVIRITGGPSSAQFPSKTNRATSPDHPVRITVSIFPVPEAGEKEG